MNFAQLNAICLDENDELKAKLDRMSYENSSLKQGNLRTSFILHSIDVLLLLDLDGSEKKISALEVKLVKMRQEIEDSSAKSAALLSTSQEEFQKQLNDVLNERLKLQQGSSAVNHLVQAS